MKRKSGVAIKPEAKRNRFLENNQDVRGPYKSVGLGKMVKSVESVRNVDECDEVRKGPESNSSNKISRSVRMLSRRNYSEADIDEGREHIDERLSAEDHSASDSDELVCFTKKQNDN